MSLVIGMAVSVSQTSQLDGSWTIRSLEPFLLVSKLSNTHAHSDLQATEIHRFTGARLGISEHIEDNHQVFTFRLTDADKQDIEDVLDQSNGRKLITLIGDCGAEYRS